MAQTQFHPQNACYRESLGAMVRRGFGKPLTSTQPERMGNHPVLSRFRFEGTDIIVLVGSFTEASMHEMAQFTRPNGTLITVSDRFDEAHKRYVQFKRGTRPVAQGPNHIALSIEETARRILNGRERGLDLEGWYELASAIMVGRFVNGLAQTDQMKFIEEYITLSLACEIFRMHITRNVLARPTREDISGIVNLALIGYGPAPLLSMETALAPGIMDLFYTLNLKKMHEYADIPLEEIKAHAQVLTNMTCQTVLGCEFSTLVEDPRGITAKLVKAVYAVDPIYPQPAPKTKPVGKVGASTPAPKPTPKETAVDPLESLLQVGKILFGGGATDLLRALHEIDPKIAGRIRDTPPRYRPDTMRRIIGDYARELQARGFDPQHALNEIRST